MLPSNCWALVCSMRWSSYRGCRCLSYCGGWNGSRHSRLSVCREFPEVSSCWLRPFSPTLAWSLLVFLPLWCHRWLHILAGNWCWSNCWARRKVKSAWTLWCPWWRQTFRIRRTPSVPQRHRDRLRCRLCDVLYSMNVAAENRIRRWEWLPYCRFAWLLWWWCAWILRRAWHYRKVWYDMCLRTPGMYR